MSRVAGIQLIVCVSATTGGVPGGPSTVRTTVAQVWVYFARFGVDCDPNTTRKYRSPGGGGGVATSSWGSRAAGVGGRTARAAHPAFSATRRATRVVRYIRCP